MLSERARREAQWALERESTPRDEEIAIRRELYGLCDECGEYPAVSRLPSDHEDAGRNGDGLCVFCGLPF